MHSFNMLKIEKYLSIDIFYSQEKKTEILQRN